MAAKTTRFGLNWFDDGTDGSITEEAGKYTGADRLLVDTLLAAIETHNHQYTAQDTTTPTTAPTGVVNTSGGELSAGLDYSYVITFVDSDGLETLPGSERTLSTPDILEPPGVLSGTTGTAGTLTPGIYDYALTAQRGTEQSALSDPFTVTLITGEDSVDLVLPALGDADYLRLWRRKTTSSGYTLIQDNIIVGTTTDTGSVADYPYPNDPAYAAPQVNQGSDIYSITLTLSVADQAVVQAFEGWKIYRTDVAGNYSAQSLVAHVTERVDEFDPESDLVVSFIDFGDALLTGTPPAYDQRMRFNPFQLPTYASLGVVPAATYPEGYPIIAGGILYVYLSGTFTAVGGGVGAASFEGTWSNVTAYELGDMVRYGNGLWHAAAPSTNVTPGSAAEPVGEDGTGAITTTDAQGISAVGDIAQWFTPSQNMTITELQLYLPTAASGVMDVEIYQSDDPTDPTPTFLGATTADLATFTPGAWNNVVDFGTPIAMVAGTYYYISCLPPQREDIGIAPAPSTAVGLTMQDVVQRWNGSIYVDTPGYYLAFRFPEYTVGGQWELVGWTVPPGGTTGQVLTKISGADGDYGWA
jgi:hypothetical protein